MDSTGSSGGGEGQEQPQQHRADQLIRELIAFSRAASAEEIALILERMASVRFVDTIAHIPIKHRGLTYQGRTLTARADSLFYHLVKRVVVEGQWVSGTSEEQYVADLRRTVQVPGARLLAYTRWGEAFTATITPTRQAVPPERQGANALPQILVVYSADRRAIVTGYMFTTLQELDIPGEIVWLG